MENCEGSVVNSLLHATQNDCSSQIEQQLRLSCRIIRVSNLYLVLAFGIFFEAIT